MTRQDQLDDLLHKRVNATTAEEAIRLKKEYDLLFKQTKGGSNEADFRRTQPQQERLR